MTYDEYYDCGPTDFDEDDDTEECILCHVERPTEDMTQCQHCEGWMCKAGVGNGCYEGHYEQVTGWRYV